MHSDSLDLLRGMNSNSVHLFATEPAFNKGMILKGDCEDKTKNRAIRRGVKLKDNKPTRMNKDELPENNVSEEIHERATKIAKALLNTPPKRLKDIRKYSSKIRNSD